MANASKHSHGPRCGHTAIEHDGHTDYLQDGHLCHQEGTHVEDHVVPVSKTNPTDAANSAAVQDMTPSTSTVQDADTKRCRTATTWII